MNVITMIGSTRFSNEMLIKAWELAKVGNVVLTWHIFPENYTINFEDKKYIADQENVKDIIEKIHLQKIDMSNEVFIMNVNGYIGKDTLYELEYAIKRGKKITFHESHW